jgi:hypothetical protein
VDHQLSEGRVEFVVGEWERLRGGLADLDAGKPLSGGGDEQRRGIGRRDARLTNERDKR